MTRAFGENLRRHRDAAKMSQRELAARAYTKFDRISQLERGVREPNLHTIVELADVLGVQPAALVEDLPVPRREASASEIVAAVIADPGIQIDALAAKLSVNPSYVWLMSSRLTLEQRVTRRERQLWPGPAATAS
jgi:transcriptional regulator with XRE-family HTH domain